MQEEIQQVVQATLIAYNPSQGPLHRQALEFLASLEQNASSTRALALKLIVDVNPGGERKYPPQARFQALRILDEFFDNR